VEWGRGTRRTLPRTGSAIHWRDGDGRTREDSSNAEPCRSQAKPETIFAPGWSRRASPSTGLDLGRSATRYFCSRADIRPHIFSNHHRIATKERSPSRTPYRRLKAPGTVRVVAYRSGRRTATKQYRRNQADLPPKSGASLATARFTYRHGAGGRS
jgi:hypothetical protein